MHAAISGLQGIAILVDDSRLKLIDITNPSNNGLCSSSFANNFLSRSVDCVFVEDVSSEAVTALLEAFWDGHAIIRLVSIINASSTDAVLRVDAFEELNQILCASNDALEFAERYLFSTKTPIVFSDFPSGLPEEILAVFNQLQSVQPAISLVLEVIEDSLQSQLEDENERISFLATFIREGVVRRFVLAVRQSSDIGNVLAFANALPTIGPSMRTVLTNIQVNLEARVSKTRPVEPTFCPDESGVIKPLSEVYGVSGEQSENAVHELDERYSRQTLDMVSRNLLNLHLNEKMTFEAIAERLGLTDEQVRKMYSEALKTIAPRDN